MFESAPVSPGFRPIAKAEANAEYSPEVGMATQILGPTSGRDCSRDGRLSVRIQTYALVAAGKCYSADVRLRGSTSTFHRAVSGQ
jgi:hypothetical protein